MCSFLTRSKLNSDLGANSPSLLFLVILIKPDTLRNTQVQKVIQMYLLLCFFNNYIFTQSQKSILSHLTEHGISNNFIHVVDRKKIKKRKLAWSYHHNKIIVTLQFLAGLGHTHRTTQLCILLYQYLKLMSLLINFKYFKRQSQELSIFINVKYLEHSKWLINTTCYFIRYS